MKKILQLLIAVFIVTMCVHAQTSRYAFTVNKSGRGKQSIIFIPGFACSGKVWDSTKINYEKMYTCYTLTMAGFAGVPAQADVSFSNWENSIAAYIKDKNILKPIIIGHSMGGALAMALAADYPDMISKIVVVDALPCLAAMGDSTFKSNPSNDCSKTIAQMKTMTDSQFYKMQKFTIPRLTTDTTKMDSIINWSVKSDRTTFAGMYCDFSNTDLREKIASVECPSLIILEPIFANYKSAIDSEFKNMKTANIQYATKGLHFIMYDDKEWYYKELNNFISEK